MSDKAFLDTNIFVYANDRTEPRKQSIALRLVREATIHGGGAVSYQVIQEFFNVVLTKTSQKMSYEEARQFLATVFLPLLSVPSSVGLVSDAMRIHERYRLSWYDSLIVAAAQQAGCDRLYSEDLQHGQQFGGVRVENPFL
jgi:predicted nucleic acid-binding protein